jgi:hypothetical protein
MGNETRLNFSARKVRSTKLYDDGEALPESPAELSAVGAEEEHTVVPVAAMRPGDLVLGAAQLAAYVASKPADPLNASVMRQAECWERQALEPMQARPGLGGELAPLDTYLGGPVPPTSVMLHNTITAPNCVTADASRERLELAHSAGALEMGIDAAETIQAANSLEKMLAHQMAAIHGATMRMTEQLNRCIERMAPEKHASDDGEARREGANVQASRLAGAISRMSGSFQQGIGTLQRLRSGGRQVVTVQHVNVNEGGQALVAGQVGGPQRGLEGSSK